MQRYRMKLTDYTLNLGKWKAKEEKEEKVEERREKCERYQTNNIFEWIYVFGTWNGVDAFETIFIMHKPVKWRKFRLKLNITVWQLLMDRVVLSVEQQIQANESEKNRMNLKCAYYHRCARDFLFFFVYVYTHAILMMRLK